MMAAPETSSGFGPHSRPRRPASGDMTSIARPAGIRNRLACSSGMPNPPAAFGSSRSCGKAICEENSAKPIAIDARLVSSTGRGRSPADRRVAHGYAVPATPRPTARPHRRPGIPPSAMKSSPSRCLARWPAAHPDRPMARPMMPMASTRPPTRNRLSGTKTAISTNAVPPRHAATQNSACQSKCSVTKALMGRPSAPPTPRVALTRAMAEPSFDQPEGCRAGSRYPAG